MHGHDREPSSAEHLSIHTLLRSVLQSVKVEVRGNDLVWTIVKYTTVHHHTYSVSHITYIIVYMRNSFLW